MNRRSFFSSLSTAIAATRIAKPATEKPRFTNRKRYHGVFDYRADYFEPPEIFESKGGLVVLDGVEIKQAAYASTETGIVRTYDVFKDGKPYATRHVTKWHGPLPSTMPVVDVTSFNQNGFWRRKITTIMATDAVNVDERIWIPADFPGRIVDCPVGGVLCETLVGKVEVWGPEFGKFFPQIPVSARSDKYYRWSRQELLASAKAARGSMIDISFKG